MRIEGLRKYQRGCRRGSHFEDVPAELRPIARMWVEKFMARHEAKGQPIPGWLKAILYGQAKRLAMKPCGSEWGRRMRARKGGLAVQRNYRLEGRRPTAIATRARLAKAEAPSRARGEVETADLSLLLLQPSAIPGSCQGWATPQDVAKQIAERVAYVLSSDDRFGVNSTRPKRWDWKFEIAPVP